MPPLARGKCNPTSAITVVQGFGLCGLL